MVRMTNFLKGNNFQEYLIDALFSHGESVFDGLHESRLKVLDHRFQVLPRDFGPEILLLVYGFNLGERFFVSGKNLKNNNRCNFQFSLKNMFQRKFGLDLQLFLKHCQPNRGCSYMFASLVLIKIRLRIPVIRIFMLPSE